MRNCKLGITMYIITFILIIFAFWFVGCADNGDDPCNLPGLSPQGPDSGELVCEDGVWKQKVEEENE
jgi:hypothetical protein